MRRLGLLSALLPALVLAQGYWSGVPCINGGSCSPSAVTIGSPTVTAFPLFRVGSSAASYLYLEDDTPNAKHAAGGILFGTPTNTLDWIFATGVGGGTTADGGTMFYKGLGFSDSNASHFFIRVPYQFADGGCTDLAGCVSSSDHPKFLFGNITPALNDPDYLFLDSTGDLATAILGIRSGANEVRDFFQAQNASGAVLAKIDSAGDINTSGTLVVGSGSTITKYISNTVAVTGASIGAGACANQGAAITETGAAAGDACNLGLSASPGNGLVYSCVAGTSTCQIVACNASAGALTSLTGTHRCSVIH